MFIGCSESIWHRDIPRQTTTSVPKYDGDSIRPFAGRSGEAIGLFDGRYFGSGESPPNNVIEHAMSMLSSCSFLVRESMIAVGFYCGTTFASVFFTQRSAQPDAILSTSSDIRNPAVVMGC